MTQGKPRKPVLTAMCCIQMLEEGFLMAKAVQNKFDVECLVNWRLTLASLWKKSEKKRSCRRRKPGGKNLSH
ncbi:hypothetical protein J6590_037647 [Homalodisca vitripennis]|nr:hypothetical protein J6590_037647 [Homalodisca vitripennis]